MATKFGEALKRARKKSGLTLREISESVGLSLSYISDMEQGRRSPPTMEIISKIETLLSLEEGALSDRAKKEMEETFKEKMGMKKQMNIKKYTPASQIDLPDRIWPGQAITQAPIWCSVDLRDGNQALSIPMDLNKKLKMFDLLVDIGFKEIEIGFPSASEVEFDFARTLIEENRIPDDVTVQVLTQAREHLIKRTFEALEGVKKAVIHLYNSTSRLQREVVFRKNRDEIKEIAIQGAKLLQELKTKNRAEGIRFQYSPESFTETELDFALEVGETVADILEASPENPVIINLPATVEKSTPNIYADQIEWYCKHFKNRDSIIVSLHAHNDRGTAIAASELALMAGADRVEGTLFGNGERTGNLDIVTMALNMFSQGVDPKLNFSDINNVREVYKRCTHMDIHERHPYVGDLVYTAFSGSHQDAISKGMTLFRTKDSPHWAVPYLPIDPRDVGRTYESIIRINSQSGKGGVAYVLEREYGFKLPREMQPEFGNIIQKLTDQRGDELPAEEIRTCFEEEYLNKKAPYKLKHCNIQVNLDEDGASGKGETLVDAKVAIKDKTISFTSEGNGPIDAFVKGLKMETKASFTVSSYHEHAIEEGADSRAAAYISVETDRGDSYFGVGIDPSITIASIKAILSALNRIKDH